MERFIYKIILISSLFLICVFTSGYTNAKEIKCNIYYPKSLVITDKKLIMNDYNDLYRYIIYTKNKTLTSQNLIQKYLHHDNYFSITLIPSNNIKDKIVSKCY